MFNSLGWGELMLLAVLALIIFGPDKLPGYTKDLARGLKSLRKTAMGARNQLRSELGPEFADIDLDSLNPRTFVRKHLFEGLDDDPFADDYNKPAQEPLKEGELAPYDLDAT